MSRDTFSFVVGLAAVGFGALALLHGAGLLGDRLALMLIPVLLICLGVAGIAASRVNCATRSRKETHHVR